MNQTEYDWHAAESRVGIACESFNQPSPVRDAALSATDSGRFLGLLKIFSTEQLGDPKFLTDFSALLAAVGRAGFDVTNGESRATDGTVDLFLTLEIR